MIIPRWSTIGLFVALVMQLILSSLQAKKTGKSLRGAVLPNALAAGAACIIFVCEFFGDLPIWLAAPIMILCLLLLLMAFGLWLVQLKRYLKEAWRLEGKGDQ
jgi:uncharacterized membrane protein YoaK (UPF0700 family)